MNNEKKKTEINIPELFSVLLILVLMLTSAAAEGTQISFDQGVNALYASLDIHFSERGKMLVPETSAPEEYRNCMIIWEHDGLPVSLSLIGNKAEQVFYMSGSADGRNAAVGYTIWNGMHTGTGMNNIYIGETSDKGIPTDATDDVVYGFMPPFFPSEDEKQTRLSEYKALKAASPERIQGWMEAYSQAISFMPNTDGEWKMAYENPYEALISYRYNAAVALGDIQAYEYADDYEGPQASGLYVIHDDEYDLLAVRGQNNVLVMVYEPWWIYTNHVIGWTIAELTMYGVPVDSLVVYDLDLTAAEPEIFEYGKDGEWLPNNTLIAFLNHRISMLDSD